MAYIVEFPQMVEGRDGLDVHKESVVATIKGTGISEQTGTLGTFTCNLFDCAGGGGSMTLLTWRWKTPECGGNLFKIFYHRITCAKELTIPAMFLYCF